MTTIFRELAKDQPATTRTARGSIFDDLELPPTPKPEPVTAPPEVKSSAGVSSKGMVLGQPGDEKVPFYRGAVSFGDAREIGPPLQAGGGLNVAESWRGAIDAVKGAIGSVVGDRQERPPMNQWSTSGYQPKAQNAEPRQAEIRSDPGAFTSVFRNPAIVGDVVKEHFQSSWQLFKKNAAHVLGVRPEQAEEAGKPSTAAGRIMEGDLPLWMHAVTASPYPFSAPQRPEDSQAQAGALLGAMGVVFAPAAPAFILGENAARLTALKFLQSAGVNEPGDVYEELVQRGWLDRQGKVDFGKVGILTGEDRPTTGNMATDLISDFASYIVASPAYGLTKGAASRASAAIRRSGLTKPKLSLEELVTPTAAPVGKGMETASATATESMIRPTATRTRASDSSFGITTPETPFPLTTPRPPVAPAAAVPKPGHSMPTDIMRWDEGTNLSASAKPHGLYFTIGKKSPHEDAGSVLHKGQATANNPLYVSNATAHSERFRNVTHDGTGPASAGINALRELLPPAEFEKIIKLPKTELIKKLDKEFPGPDYTRYYDAHELREALGAQLARSKGFDAIIQYDKKFPEFSEYVALTDKSFRPGGKTNPPVPKPKAPKKAEPAPSLFEEAAPPNKDLFSSTGGYARQGTPPPPKPPASGPAAAPPATIPRPVHPTGTGVTLPTGTQSSAPISAFTPAPSGSSLRQTELITMIEPQQRPFITNVQDFLKSAQTGLVSEFTPIRDLQRNVMWTAGRPIKTTNYADEFEQIAGAVGKAEADVIRLRDLVIAPIKDIAQDFNTYLFLRRAKNRLTVDPKKRMVGDYTLKRIDDELWQLEGKVGSNNITRMEKQAEQYQRVMDDALRLQVESGRMTEELYQLIKKQNDFYAPYKMLKYLETSEGVAGAGRNVISTEKLAKRITGVSQADLAVNNILQESAEIIVKSRMLAEKNKKMLLLDELVKYETKFIKRAHPDRYYRIDQDTAGEILNQLYLQVAGSRNPQLLEQSMVKVGQAIQFARESGLTVSQRNLSKALGRAQIGGVQSGGKVSLRAFTSEVVAHELGHSFDKAIGKKLKNVFGTQRNVDVRFSSKINEPPAINPMTGKRTIGRNEFQKELSNLVNYTGLGGTPAYRNSAKERFAEFINLYIHSPKKAKELAPTWTEYFERRILPDKDMTSLVERLSNFFHKVDKLPNIHTKLKQLDNNSYLETAIRAAFPKKAPQIGFRPGTKAQPGNVIVPYYKDGKLTAIEVSEDVATAIAGLNGPQTSLVGKALSVFRAPLLYGATGANMAFQVRNLFFADLPRAALVSRYGIRNIRDLVEFPVDWAYSLFTSMKGNFGKPNELYMEWLRSGAANSTIQRMLTPQTFRPTLGLKQPWTGKRVANIPNEFVLDNVSKFASAIEETSKITGLRRAFRIEGIDKLPAGKARDQAMSRIVTEIRNYSGSPDFLRKGRHTGDLNLLFMFFNARLQGVTADLKRLGGMTGKREQVAMWTRLAGAIGAPTTALAIYNLLPGNRENYEKIDQRQKENYWMIPAPGKTFTNRDGLEVQEYYRLPKREVSQWFANLIENAVQFAFDKDPKAALTFAEDFLENISPINIDGDSATERLEAAVSGFNPAFKAPFEIATGRDTFRHRSVEPEYMKNAPSEERYHHDTPEIYVKIANTEIAKKLGLGPLMIEQALSSFTAGGITQFVPRKPEPGRSALANNPVGRIFYRSGTVADEKEEDALKSARENEGAEQVRVRRATDQAMREIAEQQLSPAETSAKIREIRSTDRKVAEKVRDRVLERERGMRGVDRVISSLGVSSGARAEFIIEMLREMTPDGRKAYVRELRTKRILTPEVGAQINRKEPGLLK